MVDHRRDFHLPEEDVQFLDNLNSGWEAVQSGDARGVVLHGFLMPEPFRPEKLDLKIKIPADYTSGAALDMFFTDVQVTRSDGVSIPKLTQSQIFDDKQWWQWSRHYPRNLKWRPGINSLVTHICYVQHILEEEAQGRSWG